MRYNARLDCLITLHLKLSVYVKDKAAKGGAKHPLHTLETSVLSKLNILVDRNRKSGNLEIGVPILGNRLFCA